MWFLTTFWTSPLSTARSWQSKSKGEVWSTAPFHKIILNGRGHVFCVCFDFSRPFFSLRLQNQVCIINHQVKRRLWCSVLWAGPFTGSLTYFIMVLGPSYDPIEIYSTMESSGTTRGPLAGTLEFFYKHCWFWLSLAMLNFLVLWASKNA